LIKNYTAAWSEPDAVSRQSLLEAVWEQAGTYTDPLSRAADRAELHALIGKFLADYPGAVFSLKGKVDAHHAHVRFYWTLHMSNGEALEGMDYGEVSPQGKLVKIVGFF
jgi:hypothetical protein